MFFSPSISVDFRMSYAAFCTPLVSTWSASLFHSSVVKSRLWKVSSFLSADVCLVVSLLFSCSFFLGVDVLGKYAFAGDNSVLVFCALDGPESFAAVAAFCRLASWQVCFFSLCLVPLDTELHEFSNTGPALLGFARFTERLRPPFTSVSLDVTSKWLVIALRH